MRSIWRDEGLIRLPDPGIAAKAAREGRIVLTFDLDFGDILAATRGAAPSVILFRLRNQTPASVNPRLFRVIGDCGAELTPYRFLIHNWHIGETIRSYGSGSGMIPVTLRARRFPDRGTQGSDSASPNGESRAEVARIEQNRIIHATKEDHPNPVLNSAFGLIEFIRAVFEESVYFRDV